MSNKLGISTAKGFHKPDGEVLELSGIIIPQKKLLLNSGAGVTEFVFDNIPAKIEVVYGSKKDLFGCRSIIFSPNNAGNLFWKTIDSAMVVEGVIHFDISTFNIDYSTKKLTYNCKDTTSTSETDVERKIYAIYEIIDLGG